MENAIGKFWNGDWRARIRESLQSLGFDSMLSYSRARESSTFDLMAQELGGANLAPIQIMYALRAEIVTSDDFSYFAKSSLIRYLKKHIPDGWKPETSFGVPFHLAVVSWGACFSDKYKLQVFAVIAKLKSLSASLHAWSPVSADDPIIKDLFDGVEFK
jgi:hypothetical protein